MAKDTKNKKEKKKDDGQRVAMDEINLRLARIEGALDPLLEQAGMPPLIEVEVTLPDIGQKAPSSRKG